MKSYIIGLLFAVVGLIILGAATTYVMSPDEKKTQTKHAAAPPSPAPKFRGNSSPSTDQDTVGSKPRQPGQSAMGQSGPGQSATGQSAADQPLPGAVMPLTTKVQSPKVQLQAPTAAPAVPAIPQVDEQGARGTQQKSGGTPQ
jgi:hypothetical protein